MPILQLQLTDEEEEAAILKASTAKGSALTPAETENVLKTVLAVAVQKAQEPKKTFKEIDPEAAKEKIDLAVTNEDNSTSTGYEGTGHAKDPLKTKPSTGYEGTGTPGKDPLVPLEK